MFFKEKILFFINSNVNKKINQESIILITVLLFSFQKVLSDNFCLADKLFQIEFGIQSHFQFD